MYIMYIDESGDTIPLSQKGKKFLVLTGCILNEKNILAIETKLRAIKENYYKNPDIEIKSNFLRYANPDLKESSPIKLNDREKYNQLEADMTRFLREIPVTLFSVVIKKTAYWQEFPAQNPYDSAYELLLESFQIYLEKEKGLGICIIDPREGQVEKSFIGQDLERIHNKIRWSASKFSNIVERLLFATSDKTVGIQIADLYCYPIYHIFEYNKAKGEYWRFDELSYIKFYKQNKELEGLRIYPDKTKKGLRFFI